MKPLGRNSPVAWLAMRLAGSGSSYPPKFSDHWPSHEDLRLGVGLRSVGLLADPENRAGHMGLPWIKNACGGGRRGCRLQRTTAGGYHHPRHSWVVRHGLGARHDRAGNGRQSDKSPDTRMEEVLKHGTNQPPETSHASDAAEVAWTSSDNQVKGACRPARGP